MSRSWQVALLVLLAGLAMPAAARTVPGRAVDADGVGVDGADVTAYAGPDRPVAHARSTQGRFSLEVPDTIGRLNVVVRQADLDRVGGAIWSLAGDEVPVVVGQTVTVTGEVRDREGRPIAGASVAASALDLHVTGCEPTVFDEPTACGFPELRAVSDQDGRYTLRGVPLGANGTLRVSADWVGPLVETPLVGAWQCTPATVTTVDVWGAEGMVETAWMGWIYNHATGRRVAGVRVELRADGLILAQRVTDADGKFIFARVDPRARAAVIVPPVSSGLPPRWTDVPEAGKYGTHASVGLFLVPGVKVSGRVLDAATGAPWPDLWLRCEQVGHPGWVDHLADVRGARTDAEGVFSLICEPGCYRLVATYGDRAVSGEPFTVAAGRPTEGLVLQMPGPRTLRAQLFDAQGQPLAGQRIRVATGFELLGSHVAMTDRYGGLDVAGGAGQWTKLRFTREADLFTAQREKEQQDGRRKFQLTMRPWAGEPLTGRVLRPDGQPLPGATATLFLREYDWFAKNNARLPLFTARSGDDGRFTLADAPRGWSGWLCVNAPGYRERDVLVEMDGDAAGAGDVVLTPASRTVHGRVLQPAGTAAAGAFVYVEDMQPFEPVITGDDGKFTIAQLPDTPLRLVASSADGLLAAATALAPGQSEMDLRFVEPGQPAPSEAPPAADQEAGRQMLREALGACVLEDDVARVSQLVWAFDPDAALRAVGQIEDANTKRGAVIAWLAREPRGAWPTLGLDAVVTDLPKEADREPAAAALVAVLRDPQCERARSLAQHALRGANGVPARLQATVRPALARLSLLARAGLSPDDVRAEVGRLLADQMDSRAVEVAVAAWFEGTDLLLAPIVQPILRAPIPRMIYRAAYVRDLADVDAPAALKLAREYWPGNEWEITRTPVGQLGATTCGVALSHLALRLLPEHPYDSERLFRGVGEVPWRCDERVLWALAQDEPREAKAAIDTISNQRRPDGPVTDLLLEPNLAPGSLVYQRLLTRALRTPLPFGTGSGGWPVSAGAPTDADLAYALSRLQPGRSRLAIEQLLEADRGRSGLASLALLAHDPARAVQRCRELPPGLERTATLTAMGQWFLADDRGRRAWLPTRPTPEIRGGSGLLPDLGE